MEQKDNHGVLFKNAKKTKDNQPEYYGTCVIDGTRKDISVWVKKSKEGTMYMSLAFKEPYIKGNDFTSDVTESAKNNKTESKKPEVDNSILDKEDDLPF